MPLLMSLESDVTLYFDECITNIKHKYKVLSRKFWAGENFGPGDQNSRKIWSAGLLFSENIGPCVE